MMTNLTVRGPTGSVPIGTDGGFELPLDSSTPAEVDVLDDAGKLVLMGFAGTNRPSDLSAASTATSVLLYLALGAFTLPASEYERSIALIEGAPALTGLAATVEADFEADATAIADGDSDLVAAVLAARDAIVGPILAGLPPTTAAASPPVQTATARGRAAAKPSGVVRITVTAGAGDNIK